MMETILITGAGPNGVTGRRIKENLESLYKILSPSSRELNLVDSNAVDEYFVTNKIDYIIHSALTTPSRGHDNTPGYREVEDNLRMYFNLVRHSNEFKKMFYFGSGAEFDKRSPIVQFREVDYPSRLPEDKYGLIKYILNQHAVKSDNIYNLRIFGTINPYEPYTRNVLCNLMAKAIKGLPLKLRQNCYFSFIDVDDIARFIEHAISHDLSYHSYNMVSGRFQLKEIADTINNLYCDGKNIVSFEQDGLNMEYSANNDRLQMDFKDFTPLNESLDKIYHYLKSKIDDIDADSIDSRWVSGGKDIKFPQIYIASPENSKGAFMRGGGN